MKTTYLNELIEKLNLYKQQDKLERHGLDGLKELIVIKEIVKNSELLDCDCSKYTSMKHEGKLLCSNCEKEKDTN